MIPNLIPNLKKIFILISVLAFLKVCYMADDYFDSSDENMYSNLTTMKKNSKNTKTNKVNKTIVIVKHKPKKPTTIKETNQYELKRIHNSKYADSSRVVEPIGGLWSE